jgi:uncharacterized protein GlcG (DUF336 family)
MVVRLLTPLPLASAEAIIDGALREGAERAFLPLTVAVLDVGGHLLALKRQDGCGIMRADIAMAKAWGALGIGLDSMTIGEKMGGNPAFLNALASVARGRLAPNYGGLLIHDAEGRAIGAVGISGDTGDNDEICAAAGVKAAGLGSSRG